MKLLLLAVVAIAALSSVAGKNVVCYYGSWSVYRQGMGHFQVENIDPNVCTHLVYTFVGLGEDGNLRLLDAWNDEGDEWHEGAFTKIRKLQAVNPSLRVLLAVGGWNHGPRPFQVVVENPALRAVFIQSAIDMNKKYGFQGLDIDWEYQDKVGGSQADKDGLSALLREMHPRFQQEGLDLSIAVAANFGLIDANYDIPAISQNVDFINLMSYDFHGGWDDHTGHVAPTFPLPSETGDDHNLNVEAVLKRYLELGADPGKINLGFITYGRSFTLKDAGNNGVNAPVNGVGLVGEWMPEAGIFAYGELCKQMKDGKWTRYWIPEQKVPYLVAGDQWVGYDDIEAINGKLDLVHQYNLAGAMVWSIETDDFLGDCGAGTYPIINAVKNGL